MTALFLGLGLIFVGYSLGFVMGVWHTRDWVESIAPGTSRHLIDLEERQKKNRK